MNQLPDADTASYDAPRAARYDRVWRGYTNRTLAATLAMIDFDALVAHARRGGAPLRALDVACGTGALLVRLMARMPDLRAVGVDESEAMLAQARHTLGERLTRLDTPSVELLRGRVVAGPHAGLPLPDAAFDLITFTNALHYVADPVGALAGLRDVLAPGGQFIVEDFAWRAKPFPWPVAEAIIRRFDREHVRAYTCAEAQSLAERAGWRVEAARAFAIDWLWHGWALRLS